MRVRQRCGAGASTRASIRAATAGIILCRACRHRARHGAPQRRKPRAWPRCPCLHRFVPLSLSRPRPCMLLSSLARSLTLSLSSPLYFLYFPPRPSTALQLSNGMQARSPSLSLTILCLSMRPVFLGFRPSAHTLFFFLSLLSQPQHVLPTPRSHRTHERTGMERDMVDNVSALLGLPDKLAPLSSLLSSDMRRQALQSAISIAQAPLSLLQACACVA